MADRKLISQILSNSIGELLPAILLWGHLSWVKTVILGLFPALGGTGVPFGPDMWGQDLTVHSWIHEYVERQVLLSVQEKMRRGQG